MRQKFYCACFNKLSDCIIIGAERDGPHSILITMGVQGQDFIRNYDFRVDSKPNITYEQTISLMWKELQNLKYEPYLATIEQLLLFDNKAVRELAKREYKVQYGRSTI